MLRMRGFLLGLSVSLAFIVGCVAGSQNVGLSTATAGHEVVEQRWRYQCVEVATVDNLQAKALGLGKLGWEMVTAVPLDDGRSFWCFRQPQP